MSPGEKKTQVLKPFLKRILKRPCNNQGLKFGITVLLTL